MTLQRLAATCLLLLGVMFPAVLEAQYLAPRAYHRSASDVTPDSTRLTSTDRPSRAAFVLTGAVVGGVTAGVLAYQSIKNSEAILGEVGVVIAALAGAAGGALLGWAIYEIRQ